MVHKIAPNLIRLVGQTIWVLLVGGCQKDDCGVYCAGANGENSGAVDGSFAAG
jgi:hypothetical protein